MRASEGRSLFSYKLSSTFGEHQARYQMHLQGLKMDSNLKQNLLQAYKYMCM